MDISKIWVGYFWAHQQFTRRSKIHNSWRRLPTPMQPLLQHYKKHNNKTLQTLQHTYITYMAYVKHTYYIMY